MATYLSGITDYIPQVQPFKPDLNFYEGVLNKKQAQYEAGYAKLSNLYGTLLNSELSRTDNSGRRDKFFTDIENQIKKISTLDLSKSQNVNAAQKVFQPILDDKYILKDIAFTRSYRNEMNKAQYFMNCIDEKKCGGKYWEGGVRAINYMREDFAKASADESLGYQNPTYTPYVDVYKKAMEFAKEMGFNNQTLSWTDDGRYIIKTKNGPAMIPGLTEAFMSAFGNDPAVMSMYKTQAFLDRKDYSKANAYKFNGDENAAEREYLTTAANIVSQKMTQLSAQAEKDKQAVTAKKTAAEESAEKIPINEDLDAAFVAMLNGIPMEENAINTAEQVANQSLEALDGLDFSKMDVNALRYRIDNARAGELFYTTMGQAAQSYAMNTMEQDVEVDKYSLAQFEHGLKLQQIAAEGDMRMRLKKMELDAERAAQEAADSALQFDDAGIPIDTGGKGQSTTDLNMKVIVDGANADAESKVFGLIGEKALFTAEKLNNIITGPGYSEAQKAAAKTSFEQIFGSGSTIENIRTNYKNIDSNKVRGTMSGLNSKLDGFIATNGNGLFRNDANFSTNVMSINGKLEVAQQMKNGITEAYYENNKNVRNRMIADGIEDADLFMDEKGNQRPFAEFTQAWQKRHSFESNFDDGDDEYEDLYKKFTEYYNGGKIPIRSQYGTIEEGGGQNLAAQSRLYVMDPAQLGSATRARVKELYQKDIASAMRNPAYGNAAFVMGDVTNLSSEEIEELGQSEDAELTKKMLNEVMRSAFTTKWKEDKANRPVMDVELHNLVGNDPNKIGVSFTINQDFIDQFKGTEKEKGILKDLYGASGQSKISFVMDKDAAQSNFLTQFEPSPEEYIMNTKGSVNISSYSETGGYATISKTPGGYFSTTGELKYVDENTGKLVSMPLNGLGYESSDLNNLYAQVNELLKEQALDNIQTARGLNK
jgi:hypothetical protein